MKRLLFSLAIGLIFSATSLFAEPGDLKNLSARAVVGTGSNILIGGFVVIDAPAKFLLRGIGPSLAASGISNPLLDPVIEIRGASGNLIFSNDNWQTTQRTTILSTGLAPSDPREAAITIGLPPGAYTVLLRGKNGTTGVGLVEIYRLQ